MKKLLSISLISVLLSACTITGPAESTWDQEERENDNDKVDLVTDLLTSSKKSTDTPTTSSKKVVSITNVTPNSPVSTDVTAPPSYAAQPATTQVDPAWQNSASYTQWKQARENQSGEYSEFKEYQQWLEFQKLKNIKK